MESRGYEDRIGGREFDRELDGAARGYRGGYGDEAPFRGRPEFEHPRFNTLRGATRGAVAMEPRRMAELFEAGSPLAKITTLRPKDYSEARTIGERFRDGTPVIMDLVTMDNADAKRLVDFAAGLAFALRGSFDKVATKVFLLSPADIDVTAEQRRRIAEAGFYAYQ
jgi:cell division inhibitor SepF